MPMPPRPFILLILLGGLLGPTVCANVLVDLGKSFGQAWSDPSDSHYFVMGTFADSDEDAVYAASWNRFAPVGATSRWVTGWEVIAGMVHNGKQDKDGAMAGIDGIIGYDLRRDPAFRIRALIGVGFIVHSIEFPGGTHFNMHFPMAIDWSGTFGQEESGWGWFARTGYLHISNANLGSGNEGHDGVLVGFGLSRKW